MKIKKQYNMLTAQIGYGTTKVCRGFTSVYSQIAIII